MEFQAVIFCGGVGNRMPSLCQQNPKCFLPVAGIPMFWYPVSTVVRSGVQEILLIFREIHRHEVTKLLKDPPIEIPISVKLAVHYTDKENEDWGTADVLRSIANRTVKDLILMSGDFVTDGTILPIITQYRVSEADLCVFVSENCLTGPEPGPKIKKSKGRDMIGYQEHTKNIVFLASEDDFDQPVDAIAWLQKFPKVTLTALINDCHVYILRKKHLDVLQKHRNFTSVKADLVPYLLEQQCLASTSLKCFLCFNSTENGQVVAHANSIPAYFEINKQIPRALDKILKDFNPGQNFEFKKTGINQAESRIENSCQVGAGCVVKRSMIGNHCHLAEKTKVQNSLLMDGVHLGKGASVSNSILCPGAVVEEGAEVINCLVLNGQRITSGTKVQNDVVEDDEDDDGAWAKDD